MVYKNIQYVVMIEKLAPIVEGVEKSIMRITIIAISAMKINMFFVIGVLAKGI